MFHLIPLGFDSAGLSTKEAAPSDPRPLRFPTRLSLRGAVPGAGAAPMQVCRHRKNTHFLIFSKSNET